MGDSKTTKKRQGIRNIEYYDFQKTLDDLYGKSKRGEPFKKLFEKVACGENIQLAYRNLKSNTGSKTPGIDGHTIDYLKRFTQQELVDLVANKLRNYKPQSVKRVEIPKGNGKTRPLGIPTITDRLVQQCLLQILEPICEARFYKYSYGFRPLRSTKHAVARAMHSMQSAHLHFVVDVDIEGFFDNINHGKLLKQIWSMGIQDKRIIAIISKMLKANIHGIGVPTKGTPQGGIISPLLANIVLNELDWWVASQWDEFKTKKDYHSYRTNGQRTEHYRRAVMKKTKLKEMYIVRYADDFKIFCRHHQEAVRIFEATKKWLSERLGLTVSAEKSGITNLKKDYTDFLGIKLKVQRKGYGKTSKPKYVVKSKIADKAKTKIIDKIRQHIKNIQKSGGGNIIRPTWGMNEYTFSVHNYYSMATHCSSDFAEIANRTRTGFEKRTKARKRRKTDTLPPYIQESYGASAQLRFVGNVPVIPIGYCRHRKLMNFSNLSVFVADDRVLLHDNVKKADMSIVAYLMRNPIGGRSIEYNDNRLSKFVAQHGKCHVLKIPLSPDEIHCHHILPRHLGGEDGYANLVIVHKDVHLYIHAKDQKLMGKIRKDFKMDKAMIGRADYLRKKAGM